MTRRKCRHSTTMAVAALEQLLAEHEEQLKESSSKERDELLLKIQEEETYLREVSDSPFLRSCSQAHQTRLESLRKRLVDVESGKVLSDLRERARPFATALSYGTRKTDHDATVGSSRQRRNWHSAPAASAVPSATAKANASANANASASSSGYTHASVRSTGTISASDMIFDRFRDEVLREAPPVYVDEPDRCLRCSTPLVSVIEGSTSACPTCKRFYVQPHLPSAGDGIHAPASHSTRNASSGLGVRNNESTSQEQRLMECLDSIQARQTTPISPVKVQAVAQHMIRHRLTLLEPYFAEIHEAFMRRGLRDWASVEEAGEDLRDEVVQQLFKINGKYVRQVQSTMSKDMRGSKSNDNSPRMAMALSGVRPPQMPMQVQEELRRLFRLSRHVYERYRTQKTTFPWGYPYWSVGALLLLGYDEFAELFTLQAISGREYERREIFGALGWEFVPVPVHLGGNPELATEPLRPVEVVVAASGAATGAATGAVAVASGSSNHRRLKRMRAPPRHDVVTPEKINPVDSDEQVDPKRVRSTTVVV